MNAILYIKWEVEMCFTFVLASVEGFILKTSVDFILCMYEGRSKSNASYFLTQKVDEIGRWEWHH